MTDFRTSLNALSLCLALSLCALLTAPLIGCGGRGAIRTSTPIGAEIKAPPKASRDMWQLPGVIIEHLELADGMHIIDLGSGEGYMVGHLSRAAGAKGKVFAVEIDAVLIAMLRKKVTAEKLSNVEVVQSTVSGLPVAAKVDRILLLNTYPELADPVGMIGALTERLKPGGWIMVIDYRPGADVPGPPQSERLPLQSVVAEARGAGLSLVASSDALPRQYLAVFMRAEEVSVPPPAAPILIAAPIPAAASPGTAP